MALSLFHTSFVATTTGTFIHKQRQCIETTARRKKRIIGGINYNTVQRWKLHTPIPWSRNEADNNGLLQRRHQFQQLRLGSEAEITIENACASFEWSCTYPAHFFQRPSVVCFCMLEKLIDIVDCVAVGARVNTDTRPNQPSMSSFRNWRKHCHCSNKWLLLLVVCA